LNKNSKYKEVKPIKTQSNPMPIGIGYRIPTQGMSSMFGFICADVLPEQSGDLIIVPREFTAQTGSDRQYQCSNQYNIKNSFNCWELHIKWTISSQALYGKVQRLSKS